MEDPEKGAKSPDSEAHAPGKPQKTGRRRRNWRKKKSNPRSAIADANNALSGTQASDSEKARSATGVSGKSGLADETSSQADLENSRPNKRSRRRRRRKKNKNCAPLDNQEVQASPQNDPHGDDPSERHRRQPVQPEHPVSFVARGKNKRRNKQYKNRDGRPANGEAGVNGVHHPAYVKKDGRTFYAALDLGTNNCRLLVAIPQAPGRFRVVDAFSRIVRLGEGLGSSGRLSDAAMERTIDALKACGDKLRQRTKTRHRLIATEACRRAENGPAFLERVLQETGLDLEIVDRETEAQLAVSGCGSLIDRNADGVVLFDIGGGSSELALLDTRKRLSRKLSDHITSWTSLPLGVVTLSEKFGGGKHVTPEIFENMVVEVTGLLEHFEGRHALAHAHKSGRFHLLGTSGTVTTLAGVHLNLHRYDRRRVDGAWLSENEVDAMIKRILSMSFEDRVNNPCIGADRADLVLAGCAILEAIRRLWPSPRLRVADRGLREGLLTEMMNEDGVWRRYRKRSGGMQKRGRR